MSNYWRIVNDVIRNADVILLLLDARLIEATRHREIEQKVKWEGKPLIYVITKCDLADKKSCEEYKKTLSPSVFVSAKEHFGTTMLRERILIEAKRAGIAKKRVSVGVLGYPNVGKSSLINALKGRHAAGTSVLSGHTKGVQKIKADNRIILLDTPGVIPFRENDPMMHTLIGTIDFVRSKEPDMAAMMLMEKFPGKIEASYGVKPSDDPEQTIEAIALKKNLIKRGGELDIMRAARMILKDWQKGDIK